MTAIAQRLANRDQLRDSRDQRGDEDRGGGDSDEDELSDGELFEELENDDGFDMDHFREKRLGELKSQ